MSRASVRSVAGVVEAVLFDLDGTLLDSAPDLAAAANRMRVRRGLAPLEPFALRSLASSGARGMLRGAFEIAPTHAEYEAHRLEFLAEYEADLMGETRAFAGVPELLHALEVRGLPWAVVTNKAERLTWPIVRQLGWLARAGAVVCGDTTSHPKPHPAPMHEAARRLGVCASRCLVVGDDRRDIESGRAAGMLTAVAAYGYLGDHPDPDAWGADVRFNEPTDLLNFLGMA